MKEEKKAALILPPSFFFLLCLHSCLIIFSRAVLEMDELCNPRVSALAVKCLASQPGVKDHSELELSRKKLDSWSRLKKKKKINVVVYCHPIMFLLHLRGIYSVTISLHPQK